MKQTFFNHAVKQIFDAVKEYDDKENTDATFCNYFVAGVLAYYGYKKFNHSRDVLDFNKNWPMTANMIHDTMVEDKFNWKQVSIDEAIEGSNQCEIVVASQKGRYHGHVNILMPGVAMSGNFGRLVPLCCNIGKTNFYNRSLSYAFRKMPEFFLFIGEKKIKQD